MSKDWIENTLCLIKPDGVRRGLTGEVLARFERAGFKIIAMKMIQPTQELAQKHYLYDDIAVRHGEGVWKNLTRFLVSGPVCAFVLQGVSAVQGVRKLCGSTQPLESAPGTIRGDFSHHSYQASSAAGESIRNVIHASASVEEAKNEISVWFSPQELLEYRRSDENEHTYQ